MRLKEIYQPIKNDLCGVEEVIKKALKSTRHKSILRISDYLLDSVGQRIRPALVILSARAGEKGGTLNHKKMTYLAAAIELVHAASLIHDDVIDHSTLRHHRPTINSQWGENVSIALGDYLYSQAFELVSSCGNTDILSCISQAARLMSEGELIQVCERDNLNLQKESYFIIIKKKTASLFAASCQSGALISHCPRLIQGALREYGLNFGIAFQVIDDCLDLIGQKKYLGKSPGADFRAGELTLPTLHLLSFDKKNILPIFKQQTSYSAFKDLKERFVGSSALLRCKEDISSHIQRAKKSLNNLEDSCFKDSLFNIADYMAERIGV